MPWLRVYEDVDLTKFRLTSVPVGITDGDKGDVTVSSSGSVWTIDNNAVTNAKINDVDGSKVTQSASFRLVTDTEKLTWNGKQDAPTGVPDGTKYLRDDNSWQPISGGSGLTQQQVEGLI